jgi:hypothetical protein
MAHVLDGGQERTTARTGATWWQFPSQTLKALVQQYHPSARLSPRTLYEDVWGTVHEVARNTHLIA